MDKMTSATSTSTNVKPVDFLKNANVGPPEDGFDFEMGRCKTCTNGLPVVEGKSQLCKIV
jgi:hypothetical protein